MIKYSLKIASIIKETEDAITICFKQPALKKIKYVPGQYITVIVTINNRKYQRPYSISSTPGVDSTLNITVKRVLHGIVSNHIIDMFKDGDIIEVIEPMGDFAYTHDGNNEIYLWGAGSGITPLISILKFILSATNNKITLSYSNPSKQKTIFYSQLIQLKELYQDRFSLNFFCTREVDKNTLSGRITHQHVTHFVSTSTDISKTLHYICGPTGLKQTVKTTLADLGLPLTSMFSEDFEHIVNEAELKDIQTQAVQIIKNEEQFEVEVVKGKSILESALDMQIDLSYSCQTGACTLCKAQLLSGSVKIIGADICGKELGDNEYLLCCSYPLTDNVKFAID